MSKLVQLKHVTEGAWEQSPQLPQAMGVYRRSTQPLGNFLEKNDYFNAILITFCTFSEPFERTKFLMFESQLKKSLPSGQVQNMFKI